MVGDAVCVSVSVDGRGDCIFVCVDGRKGFLCISVCRWYERLCVYLSVDGRGDCLYICVCAVGRGGRWYTIL